MRDWKFESPTRVRNKIKFLCSRLSGIVAVPIFSPCDHVNVTRFWDLGCDPFW